MFGWTRTEVASSGKWEVMARRVPLAADRVHVDFIAMTRDRRSLRAGAVQWTGATSLGSTAMLAHRMGDRRRSDEELPSYDFSVDPPGPDEIWMDAVPARFIGAFVRAIDVCDWHLANRRFDRYEDRQSDSSPLAVALRQWPFAAPVLQAAPVIGLDEVATAIAGDGDEPAVRAIGNVLPLLRHAVSLRPEGTLRALSALTEVPDVVPSGLSYEEAPYEWEMLLLVLEHCSRAAARTGRSPAEFLLGGQGSWKERALVRLGLERGRDKDVLERLASVLARELARLPDAAADASTREPDPEDIVPAPPVEAPPRRRIPRILRNIMERMQRASGATR